MSTAASQIGVIRDRWRTVLAYSTNDTAIVVPQFSTTAPSGDGTLEMGNFTAVALYVAGDGGATDTFRLLVSGVSPVVTVATPSTIAGYFETGLIAFNYLLGGGVVPAALVTALSATGEAFQTATTGWKTSYPTATGPASGAFLPDISFQIPFAGAPMGTMVAGTGNTILDSLTVMSAHGSSHLKFQIRASEGAGATPVHVSVLARRFNLHSR